MVGKYGLGHCGRPGRNYPEHAATFQTHLATYLQTLDATPLARELPLRVKFISYHPICLLCPTLRYGAGWTTEMRPGVDLTLHIVALRNACAARM